MKFAKSILTGSGVVLLAGMFLAQAQAQVTYNYTGSPFTNFGWTDPALGTNVTVTFQTPTPLPPNLSLLAPCPEGSVVSLTSGNNTLPASRCSIATDANGTISDWSFFTDASFPDSEAYACPLGYRIVTRTPFPPEDGTICTLARPTHALANYTRFGGGIWAPPTLANITSALLTIVTGMNIQNQGTSLTDQLTTVLTDINNGTLGLACSDLQAFAHHLKAQTGKAITTAQAATILQWVGYISAALPGCQIN